MHRAPPVIPEPTAAEGLRVLSQLRTHPENERLRRTARLLAGPTHVLDLPAWDDFPGPMTEAEAEIWRSRMRAHPHVPRDFDFSQLERRVIFAYARATWTLQDCYWRDGEE